MKKIIKIILIGTFILTSMFAFSCNDSQIETKGQTNYTQEGSIMNYDTQKWISTQIDFTAKNAIENINQAEIDVEFTNRNTNKKMTVPGFWNGEKNWAVRFAPTEIGIWDFTLKARGDVDLALNGYTGTVTCTEYTGELEIYKRGFIKAVKNTKYFVYDDGTPFFYLGDTHWTMLTEEFDQVGDRANGIQTDSHFKYIVDKRVEQKFTVYQSEPIGATYNVADGNVNESDIESFKTIDKYFAYIAEKGLVHANSQLIFPCDMTKGIIDNIESLTRYWVARYSSYPVLWTLGQEVDDGITEETSEFTVWDVLDAYTKMCETISVIDPYNHPITAHQLNASVITASGGVSTSVADGGYNDYDPTDNVRNRKTKMSAFYNKKGHSFWASQWRPIVDSQYNFNIPKDYWLYGNEKPTINYESRYQNLYCKDYCARVQGWISYLSGMFGYGYGAQDMWYYKPNYNMDTPAFDGIETVSVEDKNITWGEMLDKPINDELTILYDFFNSFNWWELEPEFNNNEYYINNFDDCFYSVAHISNDLYVALFYNQTKTTGGLISLMDSTATYTAKWFNPRTGKYQLISNNITPTLIDGKYCYEIPEKPDNLDYVLLVTKNK